MITGAYDFLQTVELPKQSRIYLLDHLGSTEYVCSDRACHNFINKKATDKTGTAYQSEGPKRCNSPLC
jgi:replication factor C subunit 3/5